MKHTVDASDTIKLSVVIPVYNEEESLPHLLVRLNDILPQMAETYELIFVDDGSTDASLKLLADFGAQDPNIVLVEQRANFGKSAALSTGFSVARGEVIFTMDADLQDEPSEMPVLLAKLNDGYDLVTGMRINRSSNDPAGKTIPSRIANKVTRILSGIPLSDMNSGFKCYRRELTKSLRLHSDLHRYIPVLAHYQGYKVTEIPVSHNARRYGKSKYGPSRFLRSLFDLLTVLFLSRFRYRPLHLFGSVGVFAAGLGMLISFYLGLVWLFTTDPIGDRPLLLLAVLLIIIGIQFISIGLVADLVVSIDRNREDPQSTVRRIYRSGNRSQDSL